MDASIGSSRGADHDGFPQYLSEGRFEASLDCGLVRLALPAIKVGPIIGELNLNVPHVDPAYDGLEADSGLFVVKPEPGC
jgi:hypothetical protein